MKKRLLIFLFFAFISLLNAQNSPCGEWKTFKEQGNYKVYVRECPDSPIKEFKVLDRFKGNFDTLIKLMNDVKMTQILNKSCTEARIVKDLGNNESVQYFYFDMPLMLADRDVLTKCRTYIMPIAYKIESETYTENIVPLKKDAIRLKKVKTYYYFEKLPDGMIQMEYIGRADPNGWVPAWLVNTMAQVEAQKMVDKLKRLVQK